MININKHLIDSVSAQAKTASRKRMNYNFHETPSDTLHRMLNAMEPGTYVRPHKHQNPDKREAFILLRGSILIVEFSENGDIVSHTILDNKLENYGVEIPPRTYHTLIVLEENSVIYEVKDGPYDVSNDKNFAPWSPEEGSPEGIKYMSDLLEKLNLKVR